MTRTQAVQKAAEYYQKRKLDIDRELTNRENEAVRAVPQLKALMDERASLPLKSMRLAMSAPEKAAEIASQMREKGIALNSRIREALKDGGFPEDYLKPAYECKLCRDTGYTDDTMPARPCTCFEKRVLEYMAEGRSKGMYGVSFDDFDSNRVPEKQLESGISQRALTVRIKEACEEYSDGYPNTLRPGMILFGSAGLGKTFLLSCIGERLQKRGFGALAITSFELMERIRAAYFHLEDSDGAFAELETSPILLIDDLGVEPIMKNTEEYLCLLLNERMNNGLHTVITTNLTPPQLKEKYSERVMSRLTDKHYWDWLRLMGDDLRRT